MGVFFLVWYSDIGLEEGGLAVGKAPKCPVDTLLSRGRVHKSPDTAGTAADGDLYCYSLAKDFVIRLIRKDGLFSFVKRINRLQWVRS